MEKIRGKKGTIALSTGIAVALCAVFLLAYLFREQFGWTIWKITHLDPAAALLNDHDPELFLDMGSYFFRADHYDIGKAERYFSNAAALDENVPYAHYQLARINFLRGDFQQALREINKEMTVQPELKQSYYVRGLIEGYAGDFTASAADFEKFISFYPFDWAGYNDLAWVYFRAGDYEKSKGAALRGLAAAPRNAENPWLLNSAGIALLNLNKKEEAKIYFEKALAKLEDMAPKDWGIAYPGNDPAIYAEGLAKTKESVAYNLELSGKK